MNKKLSIAIAAVIFALAMLFGFRLLSGEDDWICQNGEWVEHGKPEAPKPTTPCPQ